MNDTTHAPPTTEDRAVAATVPYALTGLGHHILDHRLPSPRSIEVPGHGHYPISVWLETDDVDAWATTGISLDYGSHAIFPGVTGPYRHEVHGVLDGSCLRVRLLWTDNTRTWSEPDHA